jgi:hypothetical protein
MGNRMRVIIALYALNSLLVGIFGDYTPTNIFKFSVPRI